MALVPWRRKAAQLATTAASEVLGANGLVASAARLDLTKPPATAIQEAWQEEAWRYYDIVGELRYAANWMGNSLSRATIYPADIGPDGKPTGQPTTDPRALAAAYDLLGGPTNQAAILGQVGVHLTIAGDCYIVGETPTDAYGNPLEQDEWYVASTSELNYRGGQWEIDRGYGRRPLDPNTTVIIRVWQSHPRKRWMADSPTRAALPVLRELELLVKTAGQQMDSRLAGAGILILPHEVTFPQPSQEAAEANPEANPLVLALAENLYTPLDNPEDTSRLTPFVLQVPGEYVDKVKHLSLADQLQAENLTAREACIRRLALAMDMPPEELLGLADSNHWSAWAIGEAAIKLHLAPKLTTICNAISEGYYTPALEALGCATPYAYTLWFDTTELSERPDRSADAQAAYDKGELSGDALRQYLGFSEDDAPSREERVGRLLMEVAKAHPELLGQLLPELGIDWLAARDAAVGQPALEADPAAPASPAADGTPAQPTDTAAAPAAATPTTPGSPA